MKKNLLLLFITTLIVSALTAQNYPNIVNYNLNGIPTNGVKIKTNIPYDHGNGMYTVKIDGYHYNDKNALPVNSKPISLQIIWYPSTNYGFVDPTISTSGANNPIVWLSRENGKIVIFLDQKAYYQRFTVSAFAQGIREQPGFFQGWTVVDEPMTGDYKTLCTYKNNFLGNVGIGTDNPQSMLDVRGKIIADEVEIKVNKGADFVFSPDYNLKPLSEVEAFVKKNKHLPEIPSEKNMQEEGVNVNELQIKLLQKIEELTLYVIEQNKQIESLREKNNKQEKIIEELKIKLED